MQVMHRDGKKGLKESLFTLYWLIVNHHISNSVDINHCTAYGRRLTQQHPEEHTSVARQWKNDDFKYIHQQHQL